MRWDETLEDLDRNPKYEGRFWFEDGVYHEDSMTCVPTGSYRVYLEIVGVQAVALRLEVVEPPHEDCYERRRDKGARWARVD
jgi:hypothetical protein